MWKVQGVAIPFYFFPPKKKWSFSPKKWESLWYPKIVKFINAKNSIKEWVRYSEIRTDDKQEMKRNKQHDWKMYVQNKGYTNQWMEWK